MARKALPIVSLLVAASALAQSNAVPGTDVFVYDVIDAQAFGRRGPSYPNGEVGFGYGHAFCNAGSVHIPWATTSPGSNMLDTHFKIAFLVVRESNGRMVQVSTSESGVKHSRTTYNLGSSQCGTCQNGPGSTFRIGCYDAYTASPWNSDRYNLGPQSEIDPWLGSWNPVGSYFDRGDPAVGGSAATDGRQSLTSSQVNAFDSVKNRVTARESEVAAPGTYYGQVQVVCEGEPVANRGNNIVTEELSFNWNGSSWSVSDLDNIGNGSVLNRWTGASVELGGNGNSDGRFAVAVKVTGPFNGLYHYEYAVHNIDNHRGGASFRIPVANNVNISNVGFRDADANSLNEWTFNQTATELEWLASANNPLNWNSIYNFYFDCDVAPGSGLVEIDQARIGSGSLTVDVITDVPGGVPVAQKTVIGSSCGSCESAFYEFWGNPNGVDLSGSSMTMTFSNGAYSVGSGTVSYIAPGTNNIGLGEDDETTVTLPFSLPYPGGTTTSLIVCSNGFISPGASNGTEWDPTVGEFLTGAARWAAAWHDMSPQNAPGNGGVLYQSTASRATLTWLDVPNWQGGSNPGNSTFQIQFEPSGDVHMVWQQLSTTGNEYLVGWTPGGGPSDPGNSDLSTAIPNGFSLCASPASGISFDASARPITGTTIQLMTSGITQPGTGFGVTVLSLQGANPPLDLTQYQMEGCFAYTNPLASINQFWLTGGATSVSTPFTIPNDSSFVGLSVFGQAYAYTPGLTTLGLISSNGVVLLIGPQ
ncbi:MAG: hypothetical protein NXI31_11230 [bacterium]|nr:hypothetical protein [bacterium]